MLQTSHSIYCCEDSSRHSLFSLLRYGTFTLTALVFLGAQSVLATALTGDFDFDGDIDSVDVNLLTAEIESGFHDPTFDVDGDGLVTLPDLDEFFLFYSAESGVPLAIALVDINFDKVNTVADYQILQTNLSALTTDFTSGNLNADSSVDTADRSLYLSRGGVVPEPMGSTLVLAAIVCGLYPRRRR